MEIIVVINSASGPGGGKDTHWANVADDLQHAGIKVVGYVASSCAGKSTEEITDEADRYYDWYDLDGIFFNEVSASDNGYNKQIRRRRKANKDY